MRKENWILGLCIGSALISVTSACFVFARCAPITADWMGILVGILSLLVTVLLGWNIYTAIQLNEIMNKKIEEAQKKAERRINLSLTTSQMRSVQGYIANKDWYMTMRGYSTCIQDMLGLKDKKMARDIIKLIDSTLYLIEIKGDKDKRAFDELIGNIKKLCTLDEGAFDLYLKAANKDSSIGT